MTTYRVKLTATTPISAVIDVEADTIREAIQQARQDLSATSSAWHVPNGEVLDLKLAACEVIPSLTYTHDLDMRLAVQNCPKPWDELSKTEQSELIATCLKHNLADHSANPSELWDRAYHVGTEDSDGGYKLSLPNPRTPGRELPTLEFIENAKNLAASLLSLRDETSEITDAEAKEQGEEPYYWFNGTILKERITAILDYTPGCQTKALEALESIARMKQDGEEDYILETDDDDDCATLISIIRQAREITGINPTKPRRSSLK